jgi:voltage-gated potassium channel
LIEAHDNLIVKKIKKALRKGDTIFLFTMLFFVAFFFTGVYYSYEYEKKYDPTLTIYDEIENGLILVMGQYTDKPKSMVARGFQLSFFLMGVLIFGYFVGRISSLFVINVFTKGDLKLKNHIIICNWNKNATRVVEQLLKANPDEEILILTNYDIPERERVTLEKLSEAIFIEKLDPTLHDNLEKINAKSAKTVIILADSNENDPDGKSILIALAVKNLENDISNKSKKNKDIRVVAELIVPERKKLLLDAGADEVICSKDYSAGIIAQSANYSNISAIYHDLLEYSNDTNEIYYVSKYPKSFLNKSFKELIQLVSNSKTKQEDSNVDTPVVLIGVKKENGAIMLNPTADKFKGLQHRDQLIILGYNKISAII